MLQKSKLNVKLLFGELPYGKHHGKLSLFYLKFQKKGQKKSGKPEGMPDISH